MATKKKNLQTKTTDKPVVGPSQLANKIRVDAWMNSQTGIGTLSGDKSSQFRVTPVVPLSVQELEWLYMSDDLASTIVDSIPEDALSKNVIIHGKDSELLTKHFNALGGVSKFVQAWKWGRLFGGGAILLGVQDPDQTAPLNMVKHGRLLYAMVLERSEMHPVSFYNDPTSPKFNDPKTYRISPRNGISGLINTTPRNQNQNTVDDIIMYGKEIHESRLIMFGGASTPKTFKQQNQGWDASVLQRVYDILRDYHSLWGNTRAAVADLSQSVHKIQGVNKAIAEGRIDALMERMEMTDMLRSVARSIIIDAEGDEDFKTVGSQNLSALPAILDQANSRIASAARMPLTRLMGTSPGGLNATGDSDLSNWYGVIDVAREQEARPLLMRYLKIIASSYKLETSDISIEFPQLWQLSELELAELRNKQSTTDIAYINSGVITAQEVRSTRFAYPTDPELDTMVITTEEINKPVIG